MDSSLVPEPERGQITPLPQDRRACRQHACTKLRAESGVPHLSSPVPKDKWIGEGDRENQDMKKGKWPALGQREG